MQISQASSFSGLSIDTIRYYERSGLLPAVRRGADGRRSFSPENVEWLKLLASLRQTGMPMQKMRCFAQLYQQGRPSIPARRQMLQDHAVHLEAQRAALDHCADLLAYKLKMYTQMEEE